MNIQIFLTTGSCHCYEQNDPDLVGRNLSCITPEKLFGDTFITIGGEHHSTGFPTGAVLRVEFTMDALPDWPRPGNIEDVRLVDAAEFEAATAERTARKEPIADGEEFVAYAALEDAAGAEHYLAVHGRALAGVARARAVERFLQAPCIQVRRGEATAVLFNPANIVRISAHPGAPELPASAWLANRVDRP